MLDLSIIIVGYNNAKYLDDCLTSIYQEPAKYSFEVIYIDNNSSDHSLDLVRERFPHVRLIENKANLGFSKANNQGLKIYQARYALLLNTDTIARAGALDEMVRFMDNHPKAGVCGPKLLNPDGTTQHQGGMLAKKFWLSKAPVKVDYVIGACLLVRKEVVDKVGGMDENLFFSNDDLDWCRSIRKAGWDIYFTPFAEVVHFGGFTINKFSPRLFVEGFRGGLYFCRKHYGWLAYQLYRSLLAFSMLLAIIFTLPLCLVEINRQKLRAYGQILFISLSGNIIPAKKVKTIILVSNGHAEDLAAAAIGQAIRAKDPEIELRAIPLVGLGRAFDRVGITNLGLKKILPSGGFAKEGIIYFIQDLLAGLPLAFIRQIRIIRRESRQADLLVAVGDAYVVALCGLFGKKPLIFVDGPKSIKIEGYWKAEEWLMKIYCRSIIVQDKETADYLRKRSLPAHYLGSWVMDYVHITYEDFGIERKQTVIGILPGTREEAYDNLLLILAVMDKLAGKAKVLGLAASTLDKDKIAKKIHSTGWLLSATNTESKRHGITGRLFSKSGAEVLIAEGKFGDVCLRSKLIIGLAGIANEQAVALGRPVVCFTGKGPQTTLRRWHEIHNITGDSMELIEGNAEQKAEKISQILHDYEKMQRMGRIGKESKPQWGAVRKIAETAIATLSA